MQMTSEPQEWTPIDPILENELLNAYARIDHLEKVSVGLEAWGNSIYDWLGDIYLELRVAEKRAGELEKILDVTELLANQLVKRVNELEGEEIYSFNYYKSSHPRVELCRRPREHDQLSTPISTVTDEENAAYKAQQFMRGIVLKTIQDQKRPGGLLSK